LISVENWGWDPVGRGLAVKAYAACDNIASAVVQNRKVSVVKGCMTCNRIHPLNVAYVVSALCSTAFTLLSSSPPPPRSHRRCLNPPSLLAVVPTVATLDSFGPFPSCFSARAGTVRVRKGATFPVRLE
jgi:hypothetical protein